MSDRAILLVSPRQEVAERIEAATEGFDERLVWVSKAGNAFRCLEVLRAALVIAEQSLPDGSGIDLLEHALVSSPSTPRLLLLEAGTPADVPVEATNRARVSWILRKPLGDTMALRNVLSKALYNGTCDRGGITVDFPIQASGDNGGHGDCTPSQVERLCTLGEMSGSLIHKLNNILTVVIGHLELLSTSAGTGDNHDRMDLIYQAVSDGVDMAQRVQQFLRADSPELDPVDLNQLVLDTVKMTEPVWRSGSQQRRGTIQVDTQLSEVPLVGGRAPELREVLTNLILNGVDALPNGGRLTVRTYRMDDGVGIDVRDTGTGMSEAVRARIFDTFFTTKGDLGNGLGLSIARRIIVEHGGNIDVESHPGLGTRFAITLPLAPAPADTIRLDLKPFAFVS